MWTSSPTPVFRRLRVRSCRVVLAYLRMCCLVVHCGKCTLSIRTTCVGSSGCLVWCVCVWRCAQFPGFVRTPWPWHEHAVLCATHTHMHAHAHAYLSTGGSIPDVKAPLREVVEQVEAGLPAKTGTEMLFRNQPDTLRELPLEALHRLFGNGHFEPSAMGIGLTVPIFLSQGREESKFEGSTSVNATRTDFHCEPIANIAMQFVGRKRWTLVDPALSFGLRPSLSPDGRAYIYANVPPDGDLIGRVDKYEVTTEPGDILYVPTWWWHRIDYLPGETSFTVSLFHLRPTQMIGNNALFITVLLPNLVKELVGWKTQ